MPDITIPSFVTTGLQLILAFVGAFIIALWLSMIVWTFRDARSRSRDIFAILLATLMVVVFGPLGLLLYILLRPPHTLAELYERSLEEEALLQDLEERPRCPGVGLGGHKRWRPSDAVQPRPRAGRGGGSSGGRPAAGTGGAGRG